MNTELMRLRILVGRNDSAGAAKFAGTLSDTYKTSPQFLNAIAWTMVSESAAGSTTFYAAAEKIAARASAAAQDKDPQILDTLARAQFLNGNKDAAIATEQKAVDLAKEDGEKASYQRCLDSYQKGELPKVGQ